MEIVRAKFHDGNCVGLPTNRRRKTSQRAFRSIATDAGVFDRDLVTFASYAREDLAFALAVVLLGLLMMVMRQNAVSQVVGFMSLENGIVLAATGAKGMPLVVEISVAFSILIAFIVIGIFLFRIRERFDTVNVGALDLYRGEHG